MKIWAAMLWIAFFGIISSIKASDVAIAYERADDSIKLKTITSKKAIVVKKG